MERETRIACKRNFFPEKQFISIYNEVLTFRPVDSGDDRKREDLETGFSAEIQTKNDGPISFFISSPLCCVAFEFGTPGTSSIFRGVSFSNKQNVCPQWTLL